MGEDARDFKRKDEIISFIAQISISLVEDKRLSRLESPVSNRRHSKGGRKLSKSLSLVKMPFCSFHGNLIAV